AAGSTIAAWKLQAALTTARDAERRKSEQLIDTVLSQADANRLSRRPGQRFETLRLLQAACERADEIGSGGKWDRRVRDLAIAAFCLPDLVADIRWPGRFPAGSVGADVDERRTVCARTDRAGACIVRRLVDDAELASIPGRGVSASPVLSG